MGKTFSTFTYSKTFNVISYNSSPNVTRITRIGAVQWENIRAPQCTICHWYNKHQTWNQKPVGTLFWIDSVHVDWCVFSWKSVLCVNGRMYVCFSLRYHVACIVVSTFFHFRSKFNESWSDRKIPRGIDQNRYLDYLQKFVQNSCQWKLEMLHLDIEYLQISGRYNEYLRGNCNNYSLLTANCSCIYTKSIRCIYAKSANFRSIIALR